MTDAPIAHEPVHTAPDDAAQAPAHAAHHGIVALDHLGLIRARGDEAASFLHGQLTNDVTSLGAGEARLAGYCSAKGRLLASFTVWKASDGSLLLACHASVLAASLKRLSMFVLRARCKLSDATGAPALYGAVGPTAEAWLRRAPAPGVTVLRLPDAAGCVRALVAIEAEAEAGVAPGLPSVGDPALPAAVWRWLEVESGVPTIEAATAEHFVPQMVNFEQVGGVDFRKGCYPGQEVVARSQFRGTIKRRMFRFDVDAPAAPGDEVFAGDDPSQPAGEVVNAAPKPDASGRHAALVELRIAAAGSAVCRLRGVDGPVLALRELPYRLPGADDAAA